MEKFFGIDISKKHFDVYNIVDKKHLRFEYDRNGVKKCVEMLKNHNPSLIVMESTGGYEIKLATAIDDCRMPVAVVNPARIRDFARSRGKLAKTDKIDAIIIAMFAQSVQPPPKGVIPKHLREIKDLIARRNQLVQLKTSESNRREHIRFRTVDQSIKTIIKTIDKQLLKIDREINQRIDNAPELKAKKKQIMSMPGIGEKTANLLIANLPELGLINRRQAAALMGLGPVNRDSGAFRGKRMTGGGRKSVRNRLFMPTLSAIRYNPVISNYYQRLIEKGKSKMIAIIACMRKIITILNSMIQNNQSWNPLFS